MQPNQAVQRARLDRRSKWKGRQHESTTRFDIRAHNKSHTATPTVFFQLPPIREWPELVSPPPSSRFVGLCEVV